MVEQKEEQQKEELQKEEQKVKPPQTKHKVNFISG